ncbi:hypothetical protein A5724_29045 [Mycobacterium sp. ACS1612]|nr:hypothetical protein A5724_29045 [Mycobacterium sp. ACS1612]
MPFNLLPRILVIAAVIAAAVLIFTPRLGSQPIIVARLVSCIRRPPAPESTFMTVQSPSDIAQSASSWRFISYSRRW